MENLLRIPREVPPVIQRRIGIYLSKPIFKDVQDSYIDAYQTTCEGDGWVDHSDVYGDKY